MPDDHDEQARNALETEVAALAAVWGRGDPLDLALRADCAGRLAALRGRFAEETAAARAIYERIIDAPARAAGWTGRQA